MRLLLASRSAARARMLQAAGVPFEAVAADLDEEAGKEGLMQAGFEPRDIAEMLAEMKAGSLSPLPGTLVLGCDQVLELDDGAMLSKPGSRDEAAEQLRMLGGRAHLLHSAAVILEDGERRWSSIETVQLHVRPLSQGFIEAYLDDQWETVRWSVGGYHIEGRGVQLFERVEGSHFAIQGLPLLPLLGYLRERSILLT